MNEREFAKARKRKILDGNLDLPKGAVKCTDRTVIELLQKTWIEEIQFYCNTKRCLRNDFSVFKGSEVEKSGYGGSIFPTHLHPVVEGYRWYRGFAVDIKGGKVLIFCGWLQPWINGGAPDPIVYLLGEVAREDVLEVAQAYCLSRENQIERWLEQ